MKEKRVLCFGLIMADVLIHGLDALPQNWEQTVGGERSVVSTGGGASNSARTFGKLGVDVDLLGRVGDDILGEFVRRECEKTGVNCSRVLCDPLSSTGIAVGLVHRDGRRCFVTAQGANRNICKEDFDRVNPDDYNFLHINGYFQFPNIEQDLRDILLRFRKKGIPVSFDTASSDPFGRWYDSIAPFVDCLDYIFLNDTQLKQVTGQDSVEGGARFLAEAGVRFPVIKLGPAGCVVYDRNMRALTVDTVPLPVVDTTGAGDSFDAAFIVGLSKGWGLRKCAQFANTVAGLNCCRLGSTAGVPNFETAMGSMAEFYN